MSLGGPLPMVGATPREVFGGGAIAGCVYPDLADYMPPLRLLVSLPRPYLIDELPRIRALLAPLGRDERGLFAKAVGP